MLGDKAHKFGALRARRGEADLIFRRGGGEIWDVVNGTPGNDELFDTSGADTLNGFGGDDALYVTNGIDQANGGTGTDYLDIDYSASTAAVISTVPAVNGAEGGFDGSISDGSGRSVSYTSIEGFVIFTGSGSDSIVGGDAADFINTFTGNDSVDGGAGNDTIITGDGNDNVNAGAGDDRVNTGTGLDIADGGTGIDGVSADLSAALGDTGLYWNLQYPFYSGPAGTAFVNFEYFVRLTTGNGNDIVATASVDRDEILVMGGGDDSINVYNGNDRVEGGAGRDLLFIDYSGAASPLDDISLSLDPGIGGGVSGHLATQDGQRRIDFTSIEAFHVIATDFADTITLIALAGTGLEGRGGDDQLTAPDGGDLLDGGTGNDRLFGNAGNDTMLGGDGEDLLVGGFGADRMSGGTGNDIYFVDEYFPDLPNWVDLVNEFAGEGDDTVYASASYAIAGQGGSVETLAAIDQAATAAIHLTGNDAAQSIFGNQGNNQLIGLGGNDQLVGYGGNDVLVGGAGIDYLRGGLGNDVYGIGEGDLIFELTGEGDDSLAADIGSYFLNVGASIETLSTANQAGTFAQNLTGNSFAQSIAGSEGANVLNGNLGNDLLRGYGGADIFLFDTAPGANNHDVIADMAVGVDKIALQNAVFTGLAEGNLGSEAFVAGSQALDANDRIIWNAATNQLLYDADGNGAGAAVLFAIVNGSPNLQASDFIIV